MDKECELPGGYKTWQQALDYVKGMNAGTYENFGYTDWRLPNRKELHSLTDYSRYRPALPSGHPFTNVRASDYWSSTTGAFRTGYAWYVYMTSGEVSGLNTSYDGYVWPVRDGQIDVSQYYISGTVALNGGLLSGVTITLSGDSSGSTTTDASGNYSFTGLNNGAYTITPSKSGYTFTPSNITVTIARANVIGIDFTASASYTELLPPGWSSAFATNINNSGVVIGWYSDSLYSPGKGFIYSGGTYTAPLPQPGKGFIYSGGMYTELLPPGCVGAAANGINDSGIVVGDGFSVGTIIGFIYSGGTYTDLLPTGWYHSEAGDINDSGVVVGGGSDGTRQKGFIYSGGTYTELLPPGWDWASAIGINNSGVVAGGGSDGTTHKGFIYSGGTYTELLPPGYIEAHAIGINDSGIVVGNGFDGTTWKGFINYTLMIDYPTWSDVITKYQAYVDGQASWSDVIACYQEYVSQ